MFCPREASSYPSAGISYGPVVDVCLPVCLSHAIYQNVCTDQASFRHSGFRRLMLRCILRKLGYLQNIRVLILWHFVPRCGLNWPWHVHRAEHDKQAIVVGLLLTTPGDDVGTGQVPSTIDRRSSPVDHTRRPALCTALWAWRNADTCSSLKFPTTCGRPGLMRPRNIYFALCVCVFLYLITCFLLFLVTCFPFLLLLFFLIDSSFIFFIE